MQNLGITITDNAAFDMPNVQYVFYVLQRFLLGPIYVFYTDISLQIASITLKDLKVIW